MFTRLFQSLKNWYGRLLKERDNYFIDKLKEEELKLSVLATVPINWQEQVAALQSDFHMKFSRFVVWGLWDFNAPSRFIQRTYYCAAKRLGIPAIWLDDKMSNIKDLSPGDLVMIKIEGHFMPETLNPVRDLNGVFYCMESTYPHDFVIELPETQYLLLQESQNTFLSGLDGAQSIKKLSDEGAYYNHQRRVLCQPYGTDLLPWEFLPPVFCPDSREVNYVGTLSKDDADIRRRFRRYLKTVGLNLRFFQRQTSAEHRALIRQSRLAPSLSNEDVRDNNPSSRMFKNISYGQLGYSNVPMHQAIYKSCHPQGESIEEMSDTILGMSEDDYVSMVHKQQKVTQSFTFLQHLANIVKYF